MEHASSEKLSEALRILEDAAKQKKDDLKSVMSDKYTNLRDFIIETEHSLVKSMSAAGKHAIDAAAHAKDVSVDKAQEIVHDVDKSVHRNPWPYIAGTAAIGVLLGYILGRNNK